MSWTCSSANADPTKIGLQAARAKKLELQTRLEALQKDLAQLSDLKPGQLRAENAEIAQLNEVRNWRMLLR